MAMYCVVFEDEVEADSPEDAAILVRDMLRTGAPSSIFLVDVPGGKVIVDTEEGNEAVVRDDRNCIGPVIMRRDGPTGVLTSPVLAEFYDHDRLESKTDLELVNGTLLRPRGFGPETFYEWVSDEGVASSPFAVITVHRQFASQDKHPLSHVAMTAYTQAAQH